MGEAIVQEVVQDRMSYYIISTTGMILWDHDFWRKDDEARSTDTLMGSYVSSLVNFVKEMKWADSKERRGLIRWGKFDCRLIVAEDVFSALHVSNGSEISKEVGIQLDDFSEEVVDEFQSRYKEVLKDQNCIGNLDQYTNFDQCFTDKIINRMEEISKLYRKVLLIEIGNRTDLPELMIQSLMKYNAVELHKRLDDLIKHNDRMYYAVESVNVKFNSLCQMFKIPIYNPPKDKRPVMPELNLYEQEVNSEGSEGYIRK